MYVGILLIFNNFVDQGTELMNMIEEDVQNYKKEPQTGLHPQGFNEDEFSSTRKNPKKIPCTNFIPSKFGPQLPPLKRYEYFTRQETVASLQDLFTCSADPISLISLQNFQLDFNNFAAKINKFYKTQVLVLRNIQLQTMMGVRLPYLRVCDLKTNVINSTSLITPFLESSPHLEHLSVLENRLMYEPKWKEKILVHSLKLKSLNGVPISFQEKQQAILAVGTAQQKKQFSMLKWDWTINQVVERLQLTVWDPSIITKLSLANADLHEIHVGSLIMLQILDVNHNQIVSIAGAGLERLDHLQEIDFSYNLISDMDCLSVLGFIPNLKSVKANNNPLPQSEYKKRIIFITCNMKGTNRCPGLVTLNDETITIDQRIDAAQFYQDFDAKQTNALRWNYAIIQLYGHRQLRNITDFVKLVKKMSMSNCGLNYVDLRSFVSLQYVDLSKNNITKVSGLLFLKALKYLDLSGNPQLPVDDVNTYLGRLHKLRHVLLAPDLSKVNKRDESRAKILLKLIKNNHKLFALDNILISPSERMDLAKSLDLSKYELDKYYVHLAIVNQIVLFLDRNYHDASILPGKIYDSKTVPLLRFANMQFPQGGFEFKHFTGLTRLDLSGNKITLITDIGLQSCKNLEVLDFSRNEVDNSIAEIAGLLNNFHELEILAMAENPVCTKKSGYRISLMKKLDTMKLLIVKLKVLDQEVTPAERKEVWAYHKLDDQHKEEMRFRETMEQSGYLNRDPNLIEKINLNQSALTMVEIPQFTRLRYLLLRGNRLIALAGTGILDMRLLKCVDLRNNMLKDMGEIIQLVDNNPGLESIGLKLNLSGNISTEIKIKEENFKDYRADTHRDMLIRHTPRLRKVYCPFWEIDDTEISIDEIARNWPISTEGVEDIEKEVTKFRFEAILFRKYISSFKLTQSLSQIQVNRLQIQVLDLSGQKLAAVNFSGFSNLKKLSLRNNLLDDRALMTSQLIGTQIAELDLRDNRIAVLDTLVQFVDKCQDHLRMFFIDNNPCYPINKNSQKSKIQRRKFLHLLESTCVPAWSMILNGLKVTVVERCHAAAITMKPQEVEELRTAITLAEKGYTGTEKVVDIRHRYLTNISILASYENLIRLELSNNRLIELDSEMFKKLNKLQYLDLRNNNIPKPNLMKAVGMITSLRELYLHKAGEQFYENPSIYSVTVFKAMRVLDVLDGINNPMPFSYDQKMASTYLRTRFDVSPNALLDVEITKDVSKAQFWCIVLALQSLQGSTKGEAVGVRSISFTHHSVILDYRFMLINHIKTLQVIDGQPIPESEFNALIVTVNGMRKKMEKKTDGLVLLPTEISLPMIRRSIMRHQKSMLEHGEKMQVKTPLKAAPSFKPPPMQQHGSLAIELREIDLERRPSTYEVGGPVNKEESVTLQHEDNMLDNQVGSPTGETQTIFEADIDIAYIERNFTSIRKLTIFL
jgi:Leucine-rich repeat (LRR) protein